MALRLSHSSSSSSHCAPAMRRFGGLYWGGPLYGHAGAGRNARESALPRWRELYQTEKRMGQHTAGSIAHRFLAHGSVALLASSARRPEVQKGSKTQMRTVFPAESAAAAATLSSSLAALSWRTNDALTAALAAEFCPWCGAPAARCARPLRCPEAE